MLRDYLQDVIFIEAHELVLHKTPKAACTSIHRAIWPHYPKLTPAELPARYTALAIVRNPAARLVSLYRDKWEQKPDLRSVDNVRATREPIPGIRPGLTWSEFLEAVIAEPFANRHWMPQTMWLELRGRLPELVVRLEDLETAWPPIAARYGLPPLGRENSTGAYDWRQYYSATQFGRVAGLWHRDFEAFDYPNRLDA